MEYAAASHFVQTWGLGLLVALFVGVIVYAFWPGNTKTFERAARAPLDDDEETGDDRQA